MSDDDVPTPVFCGAYEEALFLKTLIESAGIQTTLDALPYRRGTLPDSKIYVRRADAEVAGELVADFRQRSSHKEVIYTAHASHPYRGFAARIFTKY